MGLRARAEFAARITCRDQIPALDRMAKEMGLPLYILGRGSNSLLTPQIPGIVGLMETAGKEVVQTSNGWQIRAEAGEDWPSLVIWAVEQGIGGLENLAAIPGTIGAAPVQNIGAYGTELAARFHSLTAWDRDIGAWTRFGLEDCQFAYRHSRFKDQPGRYIISEVSLKMPRDWQPQLSYAGLSDAPVPQTPQEIMARVTEIRASKLPDWRKTGNSGSFFHNPVVAPEVAAAIAGSSGHRQADGRVKLSAAWLIEQAGLKGWRDGPVGVSEQHSLVVVNHGGADYTDIARLSAFVKAQVLQKFGVTLVAEPIVTGNLAGT